MPIIGWVIIAVTLSYFFGCLGYMFGYNKAWDIGDDALRVSKREAALREKQLMEELEKERSASRVPGRMSGVAQRGRLS